MIKQEFKDICYSSLYSDSACINILNFMLECAYLISLHLNISLAYMLLPMVNT